MPARCDTRPPGADPGAAGPRTAFGDRLVLHRRLGAGWHLQQLRWRAGATWPGYTELALYAQVDAQGQLQLVNHLGIALGETPEQILQRLQAGDYSAADVGDGDGRAASDPRYAEDVRRVDADTPARFNADPSRHFEAAGSAGKLAVFAVRLDTFEKEAAEVFYIGSNRIDSLTAIRRQLLTGFERLPIAGEYIHRDAYDIGERYGKDSFLLIDRLGTARVPAAFALKSRVDGWFERLGLRGVTDRVMQG